MKISEIIEIHEMLDCILNCGDNIKDFGINDIHGEIYVRLESGKTFDFFIERRREEM